MTRVMTMLLLVLTMLVAAGCKGEEKAVTMAVINSKEVVTKCNDGMRVTEAIQQAFAERRQALQRQEQALNKLRTDPALSEAKSGKREELQRLVAAYQAAGQQLRKDVAAEEATRFKPVLDKINKVLAEYAKAHGLLSIQDVNGFAYIDPSINITAAIIKQVDQIK